MQLQLADVRKRLEKLGITLEVSPMAMDALAMGGYDPVYGARPLKRYLQKHVETMVARMILENELLPGDVICVDADSGQLSAYTQHVE